MNVEVGLSGVSLGANGAHKRFLTSVHADMLLQAIVVIAGLFAQRTHKVGGLGVRGQVRSKSRPEMQKENVING